MDDWGGLANSLSPSTLATVKRYAFASLILTFIINCSFVQYCFRMEGFKLPDWLSFNFL
jgi:hypothetical protein